MKKLLFLLLTTTFAFAQIDRVEPPFWYANMNLSEVQIMFYGKNIAQNEVNVSNGVVIKTVQKNRKPQLSFCNY